MRKINDVKHIERMRPIKNILLAGELCNRHRSIVKRSNDQIVKFPILKMGNLNF